MMRALGADDEGHAERADKQQQLAPRQADPVPAKGKRSGGQRRGDHVQPHGDGDELAEMRRAVCGGIIHLLLESGDQVLRRARRGGLNPGDRVQETQVGVLQSQALEVFPAHGFGVRIDDHDWPAHGPGIGDHIGRATFAARWLAVPHDEEQIAPVHDLKAAGQVGFLA